MANEITKLGGSGYLEAELLFIYRGLSPNTYIDANASTVTIIPTPSASLPDIAANVVTTAEKTALDAGTDAFEVVTMPVPDGLSNPDLLSQARALYATRKAAFIEIENRKYNRVGQRFDEV